MKTLAILLLIILTSCSITDPDNDKPDSTYPQLTGSYTHYKYTSSSGGLYENSKYISYDFDSTAVAWQYYCCWSYSSSGWINASKSASTYDMEWKISGSTFTERIYDNEYSDWASYSFEWVDDSNIKIDGRLYTKD